MLFPDSCMNSSPCESALFEATITNIQLFNLNFKMNFIQIEDLISQPQAWFARCKFVGQ
jgi:hypothetical protein